MLFWGGQIIELSFTKLPGDSRAQPGKKPLGLKALKSREPSNCRPCPAHCPRCGVSMLSFWGEGYYSACRQVPLASQLLSPQGSSANLPSPPQARTGPEGLLHPPELVPRRTAQEKEHRRAGHGAPHQELLPTAPACRRGAPQPEPSPGPCLRTSAAGKAQHTASRDGWEASGHPRGSHLGSGLPSPPAAARGQLPKHRLTAPLPPQLSGAVRSGPPPFQCPPDPSESISTAQTPVSPPRAGALVLVGLR